MKNTEELDEITRINKTIDEAIYLESIKGLGSLKAF